MGFSFNPFTKKLDKTKSKEVKTLDDRLDILTGDGQTTFYVATTGSDTTGNGTLANPYATVEKCMEFIPIEVPDGMCYNIKVANGTYTEFPNLDRSLRGASNIVIDGYEHPIAIDSNTYEIQSVTSLAYSGTEITLTTSPFTADQHYGKFIRILTGTYAGYIAPIVRNTANVITTTYIFSALLSAGNTFEIVNPGVIFDLSEDRLFNINGNDYSSIVFYNCIFKEASGYPGNYLLTTQGQADFSFFCCLFKGQDDGYSFIKLQNRKLNTIVMNPAILESLSMTKESLALPFGSSSYYFYLANLFAIQDYSAPDADDVISITYNPNVYYLRLLTGGVINTYQSKGSLSDCICMKLYVRGQSEFIIYNKVLIQNDESDSFIELVDKSRMNFINSIARGSSTNAFIKCINLSEILNFSGNDLSEVTVNYFANIGFGNKLYLSQTPDSTNNTNDIYFNRPASASAFPASGNSVNDGECSYVGRS